MKKIKPIYIFIAIIVLAIISRLILLGQRVVHHDEGMLAYFAWELAEGKGYVYTPQIHGPILFYVQALLFYISNTSNHVLRLGPALFGIILVSLPIIFHKYLGWRKALAISLLLISSPLLIYYSRFLVHTSLVVATNMAFIFLLYVAVKKRKNLFLYLASLVLSISFGISETSYIFVATLVLSALVIWLINPKEFSSLFGKYFRHLMNNKVDIYISILIFVLTWIVIYSVGLTSHRSLMTSLPNPFDENSSLGFWLKQHPNRLGGQPWFYYLLLFVIYEPLSLLFFAVGLTAIKNKGSLFEKYLFISTLISLGIYSWAGEKFPWLALPTLTLMIMATGLFLERMWGRGHLLLKIIIIILGLFTLFSAIRLSYFNHTDTRELAVYVQTPEDFREIKDEIMAKCEKGSADCVKIDAQIGWPLSWMFKERSTLQNFDEGVNLGEISDLTKYILVGQDKVVPIDSREICLRDWWVPNKCRGFECFGKYSKYFLFRDIWNEKGCYKLHIIDL